MKTLIPNTTSSSLRAFCFLALVLATSAFTVHGLSLGKETLGKQGAAGKDALVKQGATGKDGLGKGDLAADAL